MTTFSMVFTFPIISLKLLAHCTCKLYSISWFKFLTNIITNCFTRKGYGNLLAKAHLHLWRKENNLSPLFCMLFVMKPAQEKDGKDRSMP